MTQTIVNIPQENIPLIKQLLEKLGGDISESKKATQSNGDAKKIGDEEVVSPTYLFGKWKDMDINPKTWRRKVWRRKR